MQKFYSLFERYFYLLILGLIAFIPLYPKFPLLNVSGTYVAIRLEDVLIAFITLLWLVGNLRRIKSILSQTVFQAIILFWLIGGLSVISGLLITHSITVNLGLLHWLRRVEYMSLFIVAATSFTSQKQIQRSLNLLLLVTAAVIIYGFGQIWLNFPVISTTNREFSKGLILYLTNDARVNSTFAGHYDLAVFLSISLMFFAGMFLFVKKLILRVLIFFGGLLSFILLGFTAARVSFVAVLFGLAITFWFNKKRLLLVGLIVAALGLVAVIPDLRHRLVATVTVNFLNGGGPKYNPPPNQITVFTNLSKYSESSKAAILKQAEIDATKSASKPGAIAVDTAAGEPINTTELGVYRSWGIRLDVEWPRAIGAFTKNPLLGTGYSSLTIATDNDYLRILGEVGLLGFLSLALVFFIIIRKIFKSVQQETGFTRLFAIAAFSSISIYLLTATFIDVLEASKVAEIFWLILGIAWAVATQRVSKLEEK